MREVVTAPRPADACVAAYAPRERVRALARGAFPKRRARVVFVRTAAELVGVLRTELVDAVLVDLGPGTDEGWRVAELARAFPTAPFVAVLPLRASEGGVLAHAVALGIAAAIVDGVDDAAVRELMAPLLFTSRFAHAFAEPPPTFVLRAALQQGAWTHLVGAAGRLARTDELAAALAVTREHLSRSFGTEGAPRLKQLIDFVRLAAAAELARNPGYQVRDVAAVLGFASSSHLARAAGRLVGLRPSELAHPTGADLVAAFAARATEPRRARASGVATGPVAAGGHHQAAGAADGPAGSARTVSAPDAPATTDGAEAARASSAS